MKRIPNIPLNIVDVRDVADLHIRAMENANAAGERFIATADGQITMTEMAAIIRQHYPQLESKVADKILPNWMVRVGSLFNQQAKEGQLLLDMNRNVSNQKARKLLGWQPIGSIEETILATLQSMEKFGLLKWVRHQKGINPRDKTSLRLMPLVDHDLIINFTKNKHIAISTCQITRFTTWHDNVIDNLNAEFVSR